MIVDNTNTKIQVDADEEAVFYFETNAGADKWLITTYYQEIYLAKLDNSFV